MMPSALRCLSLFTLLQLCLGSPLLSARTKHPRAQFNQNPTVSGNADDGWQFFPNVTDFTPWPEWELEPGVTFPLFQSAGKDASKIKRAVIVLPGKLRDCWYYANSMQNALYIAAEEDSSILLDEVSIMGPCYFTDQDKAAGAAKADVLEFGDTTWASGHYNTGPDGISKYSAYKVLDKLVDHYLDRSIYPNLNVVVVAGHSLGAQMSQRYAALRLDDSQDDRLHYWVANAGSLLWLVKDRPHPDSTCEGFDDFKYGLAGGFPGYATAQTNQLGRAGIVSRYNTRQIHYAWGLDDHGNGDTRCEAETQGDSHLERGQNFVTSLTNGVPEAQTVDWVEGISHFNEGMMNSDAGIDKLFRINYNG